LGKAGSRKLERDNLTVEKLPAVIRRDQRDIL
jgi:hypothetical protein